MNNPKFSGEPVFTPKTTTSSVLTETVTNQGNKSWFSKSNLTYLGIGAAIGGLAAYAICKLCSSKPKKDEEKSETDDKE